MAYLNLTKGCPQCGTTIPGWYARILSREHGMKDAPLTDAAHERTTWGPFACTACGAKLVLIRTDPKLVHKMAGAVFVSIVAGFVLPAFIGLASCFSCGLILVGLLIALSVGWIITRSIKVGVVKPPPPFVSDRVP